MQVEGNWSPVGTEGAQSVKRYQNRLPSIFEQWSASSFILSDVGDFQQYYLNYCFSVKKRTLFTKDLKCNFSR